jgi:ubiquinone/menaquinone biosynthesis C-methylase UbiE
VLSRRLAGLLGLGSAARVLDVAAGRGATALLLAQEHGDAIAAAAPMKTDGIRDQAGD